MGRIVCIAFAFAGALLVIASVPTRAEAELALGPVPVILDTDMWGDIDDVFALAGLHALQDRGEAKILAITSSTSDRWVPPYIDLINTFYDHASIPVGQVHNGVVPPARWAGDGPAMAEGVPMYTQHLAELRRADGGLQFPHALHDGVNATEAVALLRETLASQADGSVVMIGVGFSTNFARLLDSRPDFFSALNGAELVRRKARLLVVMSGRFLDGHWNGEAVFSARPEYNIRHDIPSAQRLFTDWPTPIVASPGEVGFTMRVRGDDIETKLTSAEHHPVAITYRYMDATYQANGTNSASLHDHKTFDLTAVLYAVRPSDNYFTLSPPGEVSVASNGVSTFEQKADGNERFLTINDDQRARTLEAMTMLITQPPIRTTR